MWPDKTLRESLTSDAKDVCFGKVIVRVRIDQVSVLLLWQMKLAGLPHLWTEKSDVGLGASPPMGVKEAAPRRMSRFLN